MTPQSNYALTPVTVKSNFTKTGSKITISKIQPVNQPPLSQIATSSKTPSPQEKGKAQNSIRTNMNRQKEVPGHKANGPSKKPRSYSQNDKEICNKAPASIQTPWPYASNDDAGMAPGMIFVKAYNVANVPNIRERLRG